MDSGGQEEEEEGDEEKERLLGEIKRLKEMEIALRRENERGRGERERLQKIMEARVELLEERKSLIFFLFSFVSFSDISTWD